MALKRAALIKDEQVVNVILCSVDDIVDLLEVEVPLVP